MAPTTNNTTATPLATPPAQRQNLASPDTVSIQGHVYLEGEPVAGAYVIAFSYDGKDSVSTTTDKEGAYALNIAPGIWNNLTAYYQDLKHTVWPVYLQKNGEQNNQYDITLTKVHKSTLTGSAARGSYWSGSNVYIQATPASGNNFLTAITGDNGNYSMDVVPGDTYYLSGNTYMYASIKYPVTICFRNVAYGSKVTPGPDETILVDYQAIRPEGIDPTRLTFTPKPDQVSTEPVYASGHVYLDGKPVAGARVEAVTADWGDRRSAITDGNGSYVMEILPRVPYNISAKQNGLEHKLWPVYNGWDKYDINLSHEPSSSITGMVTPHHILIEAIPVDGGSAINTTNGYNTSYSLELRPGVAYRLSARDYYGQIYFGVVIHYRNSDVQYYPQTIDPLVLGANETAIVDVNAYMFP